MMENVDVTGQEEYIWAMRSVVREVSDYDLWLSTPQNADCRVFNVLQRQDTFIIPSKAVKTISSSELDFEAQILASLVPDEIINGCSNFSRRPYEACLLYGNISGFTTLCDSLNLFGKGGPSRLTPILNGYLGSMVQEILTYGADILHLSAESFLVMFKMTPVTLLADCVHLAIDCALTIQKSHGLQESDSGVNIRLKMGIAAGDVIFSVIGFSNLCNYVIVGQSINDIKDCDKHNNYGEIMVSQSAWENINPTEYHVEYYKGGTLIKVHGLGLNWRSPLRSGKTEGVVQEDDSKLSNSFDEVMDIDDFSLRQSVVDAIKMGIKKDLRKFILKVIIRAIDMVEPLDYLTEMRQIVVICMNVVIADLPLMENAELVNKCFKIVLSVSDSMEGTLTKVNTYEKDLLFIVAFGFRGFKHENECQLALRCAAECSKRLKSLTDVTTISVGVTTGMTYCGIVGHNLRREFTMLGQSVTKSQCLMAAYIGKVTCDRDTFLHSKMEAKNFILQEHRSLVDVTQAGPIYEFNETAEARGMARIMTKFPLLGRDEEINIYLRILNGVMRESGYFVSQKRSSSTTNIMKTMLHVIADAKLGKSRLIDEFVCITPEHIPICRYNLIPPNHLEPYYTTRQIFALPLDIEEPSNIDDRQLKLRSRLRYMLVPELICVLNPVFNVNFPMSELYKSLTKREKQIALAKMIKQLCYGTFPYVWSIMIENGEYIDKESWKIIAAMGETTLVCITITTCALHLIKEECNYYLFDNPRVLHLHLKPLDKWYHVGFACQILGVYAIPPELEKVIQLKSNGNAGWIESFLISLLQGGNLYIEQVDKLKIDDLGLVTPPIDMLMKLSKRDIRKLAEEQGTTTDTSRRGWSMYVTAYRESRENIQKSYLMDRLLGLCDTVPVCFISTGVNIDDVDNELSAEVYLMKTFDSLSSFEQRLLKCSAVIGYILHRRMLEYVMNTKDIFATALAVKKLFEIKIMCCSRGDFTQGDTFALSQKRSFFNIKYDNNTARLQCDCLGIRIPEKLSKNLPQYAMCGLLSFKDVQFRDIMYTMLTDQQKKEFHGRAMQYLEMETRKCRSCGHGVFMHILGKKHTHNDEFNRIRFIKRNQRLKKARLDEHLAASVQIHKDSELYQEEGGTIKSKSNTVYHRNTRVSLQSDIISKATIELNDGSEDFLIPRFLGSTTVKVNRYQQSLLKTFSNYDFSICDCPEILVTMYKQMMDHCNGAGLQQKLLMVMLEYSHLCISTHNVPQALQILNAAMDHVNKKNNENENYLKNWTTPIARAEVYTLKGFASTRIGQYEEASKIYYKAMCNFGYPFPTHPNRISIKYTWIYMKIMSALLCCNRKLIHSKIGGEAQFCDNMSICLTHMCNNFMILKQFQQAKLAATWSLYNALCADQDFPIIADAYANMIRIMNHYNKDKVCVALEVHALCMCHRKRLSVERDDLWSVVKLYTAIFRARFQRSEILMAVEVGYVILRICGTVNDRKSILNLYPLIIQALIMLCKVDEAVYILNDMELKSEEDLDYSGKLWYFALAIAIHLDSGYSIKSYKACEQFMNIEGEHVNCYRDPDSKRRYLTVMWLWCIRIRDYEAASTWQVKAYDTVILQEGDTIENQITALYHLEGLLLYMADKSDRKNLVSVSNCYNTTEHLIQMLDKAAQTSKVIEARLWHLKAFYRNIRYDDKRSFSLLKIAKEIAIKRGNILEQLCITHSELAWNNDLNSIKRNFWKEHSTEQVIDYLDYDHDNCNIIPFTLEPPIYV